MTTYPGTVATSRIWFPPSVIVCPCGLHYMVRGRRIRPTHCEQLRTGVRW